MRTLIAIIFFIGCSIQMKADHRWLILVNEERVFECVSTCSENGFNANMLKAKVKLKAGDKITIVYTKDSNETNITKNIIVTDSAQTNYKNFPIFDAAGNHAIAVKADDLLALNKVILWYSETKKVGGKEITTPRIALVYFE